MEDVQYTGGYHEYSGGYHEYTGGGGGCSVHWGDIMSTPGGYHDTCGGRSLRKQLNLYGNPCVLMISPHTHHDIPQCTHSILQCTYTPRCTHDIPTLIMVSLWCTHGISQCTEHPRGTHDIPQCIEDPQYTQ